MNLINALWAGLINAITPSTGPTPFHHPKEAPHMYEISKDFHFSASHILDGLPPHHPCGRLHGHNFIVRLHLAADELDDVGFVQDYGELKNFQRWLDERFDHQHLNDRVTFNPTSENMARYIYNKAHELGLTKATAVSWSETPKTWATYTPKENA